MRFYKYFKKNSLLFINTNIIDFLKDLQKKEGSFILFPNGESLIREVLKEKESLEKTGIKIPISDLLVYNRFSNKQSFVETCNEFKLNIPPEFIPNLNKFEYPFVVKPKKIKKAENILCFPLLVENEKIFRKFINLNLCLEEHFYQKYVGGANYYYCATYTHGKKKTFFVQRNLVQQPNGKSIIKAEPSQLPEEIINKIDKMFGYYRWQGIMMFELKQDLENEAFYAIECNPRFWGPLQLSLDNNINFIQSLLDDDYVNFLQNNNIGYLWLGGFLHGLFLRIKTKSKFKKFKKKEYKIKFKDVWFRKKTFFYFFYEFFLIIYI